MVACNWQHLIPGGFRALHLCQREPWMAQGFATSVNMQVHLVTVLSAMLILCWQASWGHVSFSLPVCCLISKDLRLIPGPWLPRHTHDYNHDPDCDRVCKYSYKHDYEPEYERYKTLLLCLSPQAEA